MQVGVLSSVTHQFVKTVPEPDGERGLGPPTSLTEVTC